VMRTCGVPLGWWVEVTKKNEQTKKNRNTDVVRFLFNCMYNHSINYWETVSVSVGYGVVNLILAGTWVRSVYPVVEKQVTWTSRFTERAADGSRYGCARRRRPSSIGRLFEKPKRGFHVKAVWIQTAITRDRVKCVSSKLHTVPVCNPL